MKDKAESEDEEFARTGVFRTSFQIEINITQKDMEKELVKEIEGKTLDQSTVEIPSKN